MEPVRRNKRIKRAEAETRSLYLPEGIVVHILAKLPIKSVLRFSCVSKYWRSLISNPNFNLSTQRQQVIVMSMPVRESKYQKSASLHLIDDEALVKELRMPEQLTGGVFRDGEHLRGSCNGLVLVSYDQYLFLWNPLTRWCNKVLSYYKPWLYSISRLSVSGLCYDSSTDDYKAVFASGTYHIVTVTVASFRNKTWTEIDFPHNKKNLTSGPTVNDRVHWLVHSGDQPYLIVSFDPQMDEFVDVPVPQNVQIKSTTIPGFGVLGGCLSLALSADHERFEGTNVEVFAMKEYGDEASWTSLFIISDVIVFNRVCTSVVPLCFTTEGEVLFQREGKWGIMAYNPERNSVRAVRIPRREGHIYCSTSFVGSLVTPPSYNWDTEGYTEISLSGQTQKYTSMRCRVIE